MIVTRQPWRLSAFHSGQVRRLPSIMARNQVSWSSGCSAVRSVVMALSSTEFNPVLAGVSNVCILNSKKTKGKPP